MRLINAHTYKLEEHLSPGPYAILSHTWRDGQEVLYAEYAKGKKDGRKSGSQKIIYLCQQASNDGLDYVWIDTCCIDKSSSAELSEAINSMYAWYEEAQVCYVYLDDVTCVADIQKCRWLSRGWTLQELIAPSKVRFYGVNWVFLGTKESLLAKLVEWTDINQVVLESPSAVEYMSAATKMSWVASRRTTRPEDLAYCLLGIFGVNMPLIYGERQKAFVRLQYEILRQTQDASLLAFDRSKLIHDESSLLSSTPEVFSRHPKVLTGTRHYCEVTSEGVTVDMQLVPRCNPGTYYAVLACRFEFDHGGSIALSVVEHQQAVATESCFSIQNLSLTVIGPTELEGIPYRRVSLLKESMFSEDRLFGDPPRYTCILRADSLISHGYKIFHNPPSVGLKSWDAKHLCSEVQTHSNGPIVYRWAFVHWEHAEAFLVSLAINPFGDFSADLYMNVKTKSQNLDCDTWLSMTENMNSAASQSSDDRYQPLKHANEATEVIDGVLWVRIHRGIYNEPFQLKPFDELKLQSRQCFKNIVLSAQENHIHKWTFTLDADDHCDMEQSHEDLKAKPVLRKSKKRKRG